MALTAIMTMTTLTATIMTMTMTMTMTMVTFMGQIAITATRNLRATP
jgi:hypothetical protein